MDKRSTVAPRVTDGYRGAADWVTKDHYFVLYRKLGITSSVDSIRKPPSKATEYRDAQDAIDDTLDAWLPRLIENNERLIAVLKRVREFCQAGMPASDSEAVSAEVDIVLRETTKPQDGV